MALVGYILAGFGGLFLLVNLYLWFLAAASFLPRRTPRLPAAPRTRFVVVVPAHNEAKVIGRTLESLQALDYPEELLSVVVVADNCTDDTAAIVRSRGARCLDRIDAENRGKGFALDWAFGELLGDPWDAAVIIDADTIVAADFLRLLDARLQEGEKAVQGYYDVLDPEGSPMTSLSYLGFVLNRSLRYRGRAKLGGSSNLLGNGMAFTRDLIERHGWPAKSVVEDLEFEILLNLEGTRVDFAAEARIFAEIPGTFEESATQRTRWDLGKFKIRNTYLPRLAAAAFRRGRLGCLDRAMELLIPPYSILWAIALGLFAAAALVVLCGGSAAPFVLWTAGIGAQAAYVLLGLVVARASWKIYRNLLYAPFFVLWRVKIILQGTFARAADRWVKTER